MKLKTLLLPLMLTAASTAAHASVGENVTLARGQVQCTDVPKRPCPYCYNYGYGDPPGNQTQASVKVTAVIDGAADFSATYTSCAKLDQLLGASSRVDARVIRQEIDQVSDSLITNRVSIRIGGPQGLVLTGYGEL